MLDAEISVRSKNRPPRTIPEKVDLANQAVQIPAVSLSQVRVRIPVTLLVAVQYIHKGREKTSGCGGSCTGPRSV